VPKAWWEQAEGPAVMTPVFFDPHICNLPPTADRTEMADLECQCGRRWHLEWFRMRDGQVAGPSWILDAGP
jgi:hypothetical protein